ncbi:hypothetical protein TD95_003809 [Thielaviopsis punctulata]|uniref:Major facilitator superfamily (MFS) profile domain-containing protein n=1 Tax=Thielaviopsis punctulata TaxID=72032 RepID=A0A0F4ZCG3_9PEZI|nr:hypothetical protein TD95_003809 [Thielaviopsis punctulata]
MDVRDPDPIHHAAGEPPYSEPYVEKIISKTMTGPAEAIAEQQALEELTRQRTDPNNYPEGGFAAWLVVFGSFCGATACFGLTNSIGVLHTYVTRDVLTSYSDGTVGWIFSIYVFISLAGGVVCGPMFDLYGPRWMVFIGSVFMVAGVMLTSFATQYWQYVLSFSVLTGIGTSIVFTPSFAAPGHWFLRRRGLATGIAATGGSVGGTVFPLMLEHLIPKIGFAWSLRALGFIMLGLSIFAYLLIRSRLPPLPNSNIRPDPKIFKQIPFSLLAISVMLMELSLFVPITYIGSYVVDMGMKSALSYQLIAILNGGSFFGRVGAGLAADKFGRFNTLIFFLILCTISCFCLWLPAKKSTGLMVAFSFVFGVASGSNISLVPVCVGQLCRTEEYGRYYATLYTIVSIGPLIGVPIGGNILQASHGSYRNLIIFTAVVYISSLACAFAARGIARGWKLRVVF